MKTSFRKLRGLAFRHGHHKDRRDLRHFAPCDELDHAAKDMEDMRDCYDSLLSAAAATANSAFEFSESLREMGACLLEKTALNDDEESGKVLLMLGKVQYELQKLVDSYRSHIFQTITIPSESLLNELRNVEEMKRQCDEKRNVYDYMTMRQRESGRGKSGKGESFSKQQLQTAHEEYDEEATLFVFRLKSLKQGQSRSLLTQAARHHAAQLCFFKKALKSLEDIEPHVKLVTEQQHIDYHFSELEYGDGDYSDDEEEEDDDDDDDDDDEDFSDALDDGELSFDYKQNDRDQDVATSRNSMELDIVDNTFPEVATLESTKENRDTIYRNSFSFKGENRKVSQSAPLFAENKRDSVESIKQTWPAYTKKFNTYALPLPNPADTKSSNSGGSVVLPQTLKSSLNGGEHNLWHSSPLEPRNYEKLLGDGKHPGSKLRNAESVLRESNKDTARSRLPPQLDGSFPSQHDPRVTSDSRKVRRQSFSGPFTSRAWLTKPASVEHAGLYSGPILQNPTAQLLSSSPKLSPKVSPKVSPTTSPTFLSSPKISELHELPRPPAIITSKSPRPLSLVGHSAPLARSDNTPPTRKSLALNKPSPLPTPQAVSRSFSIPSSSFKSMAMSITKPHEATQNAEVFEDMISPPLTPISLSNLGSPLTGSENTNQTIQIRGAH
ncbi:uncharacterized protein At2g33490 [Euphorbia lathyris]|uniref:uncharacterized protein At2g33490 n=1 Tax=Euphorbia lathyris TaxID=212925 RepID=UPI0033131B71